MSETKSAAEVHVTGILEYRDAEGRVIKSVPFETDVETDQESENGMDL